MPLPQRKNIPPVAHLDPWSSLQNLHRWYSKDLHDAGQLLDLARQRWDMTVSKKWWVSPKMDGENNGKPNKNGWFGGKTHYFTCYIWGFPQQPWVFLVKMISTWGGDWGNPPFKETPIWSHNHIGSVYGMFTYSWLSFILFNRKCRCVYVLYIYIYQCIHIPYMDPMGYEIIPAPSCLGGA